MEWTPTGGWNPILSKAHRAQIIQQVAAFRAKGISEAMADNMAHMILFKQWYGVQYSEEQEALLTRSRREKPVLFGRQ